MMDNFVIDLPGFDNLRIEKDGAAIRYTVKITDKKTFLSQGANVLSAIYFGNDLLIELDVRRRGLFYGPGKEKANLDSFSMSREESFLWTSG